MSGHTKMLPVLAGLILCPRAEAAEFEPLNPTSSAGGQIIVNPASNNGWESGGPYYHRRTADFNGDGYADLWLSAGGKNFFMLNNQAGHFEPISASANGALLIGNGGWGGHIVSGKGPYTCRLNTGDFNGDGCADLWANCDGRNYFMLYNQAGHFRSATMATDGYLPLASDGNWASNNCRVNTGDFNGDGHSDLWANCNSDNYFLVSKEGTFVSVSASHDGGLRSIGAGKWASNNCRLNTGDFNADGYSDLWANCNGDNYFMLNTQDLWFAPLSAKTDGYVPLVGGDWASAACSLFSGDFDKDGPHDLWAHCEGKNYFLRRNFFSKYYLKYELVQNVLQQHAGDFVLETITSEDGGSIDNCFGDGELQQTKTMTVSKDDTTTLAFTHGFMNSYTASFTAGVSVTASVEADLFFGSASLSTTVSFSTTQEFTAEESASKTKSFSETSTVARTQSHTVTAYPRTCLKYEVAATMTKDPLVFNMMSTMKLTVYPKAYMQDPAVPRIDDPAVLEFVMARLPYTSKTIASDSTIRFETGATVSSRYFSSASIRALECVCPEQGA